MTKLVLAAAFVAALAAPASAQVATAHVHPSTAARVKVTVDSALAASAKVSADSAYSIARAKADNGEVSSAKLETRKGRLVYQVQVLNKSKRATTVTVDAMTGEVVKAEAHGGLKATAIHHKENKKLLDARRDSAKKAP